MIIGLSAVPVLAQDGAWTFDLSMNLWFSGTGITADTPNGQVDT